LKRRQRIGDALLRCGLPQAELSQRTIDSQPRELLRYAVLAEAGAQVAEIDALDTAHEIAMRPQALSADMQIYCIILARRRRRERHHTSFKG
jgi:hypothetical protein